MDITLTFSTLKNFWNSWSLNSVLALENGQMPCYLFSCNKKYIVLSLLEIVLFFLTT